MGDYGFEGAAEFGGSDFPTDFDDLSHNLHRGLPYLTKLPLILLKNREYQTSFTVFPQDCNYNDPPSIFGGKMLAEMDNCAAMTARRVLYANPEMTDAITVAVHNVSFSRPAFIGEIVHIRGRLTELGKKSIKIIVECRREKKNGEMNPMASGEFTFVARKMGVPAEHGLKL